MKKFAPLQARSSARAPETATAAPAPSPVKQAQATAGSPLPLYVQASAMAPVRDAPTTADKGAGADVGGTRLVGMASAGVAQADAPLPHLDKIQSAFGRHGVGQVRASVGGAGGAAAAQIGARAYTVGDRIGFREAPDLRLAAHEAAHVVQQRAGVHLKDGVGTPGDDYERHADAVAEAVVSGQSVERMLGAHAGGGGGAQRACACGTCSSCGAAASAPAVQMEMPPLSARALEPVTAPSSGAAPAGGGGAPAAAPAGAPPAGGSSVGAGGGGGAHGPGTAGAPSGGGVAGTPGASTPSGGAPASPGAAASPAHASPSIPMHIRATAARGAAAADGPLPHLDRVQQAFGAHDVSHVRAAVGGAGGAAASDIGARAFAMGDAVAFLEEPDVHLVAHEATHVVQQRAGLKVPDGVGRPGDEHERAADAVADAVVAGHSAEPILDRLAPHMPASATRPALPADAPVQRDLDDCTDEGILAFANETVELQGTGTFDPSADLRDFLSCTADDYDAVEVKVRFGALASGTILITTTDENSGFWADPLAPPDLHFNTVDDDQDIALTHPSIPGAGAAYPPRLKIRVEDGVVTGHVSFWPGMSAAAAYGPSWSSDFDIGRALGWEGLVNVGGTPINLLAGGVLIYGLPSFTFDLSDATDLDARRAGGIAGGGIHGTGSFLVIDAAEIWWADAAITGDGIAAGAMPLHKTAARRILGSGSYALALPSTDALGGRFSGSVEGSFAGGMLSLTGRTTYRSRRSSGSLTVMLAPRARAWEHVIRQLPGSANAPHVSAGAALASGYVLVGWGEVDFAVNDWLRGSVSAVLDPDGYITSHGRLRTTRDYQFLTDRERYGAKRTLGSPMHSQITFLDIEGGVADITGTLDASMEVEGRVGPGRVYDVAVAGTFSTRPGAVFEASATGSAEVEGWARLTAHLTGGLHFRALKVARLASAELRGTGTASVRAVAGVAAATFERIVDPADPSTSAYRLAGDFHASGEAVLGLSGQLVFSIVGMDVLPIDLGSKEWNIGSIDVSAHLSHLIGSHDPTPLTVDAPRLGTTFSSMIQPVAVRGGADSHGDHRGEGLRADTPGAPVGPPAPPPDLRQTFTMHGHSHTMWVEHQPNARIFMSSDPGPLDDKLEAEVASVEAEEAHATGDARTDLVAEEHQAEGLLGQALAVEHALDDQHAETDDATDTAGFHELASEAATYGAQHDKGDFAEQAVVAPAVAAAAQARVVNGRWVVTNAAELAAVRAAAPNVDMPPDIEPEQQAMWTRYASGYFPERLAELEADLAASPTTSRQGPQDWPAYLEGQGRLGPMRAAKLFQPVLRDILLAEHPEIDPTRAEIDVGVQSTRRGVSHATHFADVVIPNEAGDNVEVYSAKVHDIGRQAATHTPEEVENWIRARMEEDIDEAAQKYGYEIEYRRRNVSQPDGTASAGGPRNPLFERRLYVRAVHVVWQYSSTLVPHDYVAFIQEVGQEVGTVERARAKFPVDFLLRPQP